MRDAPGPKPPPIPPPILRAKDHAAPSAVYLVEVAIGVMLMLGLFSRLGAILVH